MRSAKLLGAASAASLALNLAGVRVALADRVPYDVRLLHGTPSSVTRDVWLVGTGISAPVTLLAVHTALTAMHLARPTRESAQALAALGAFYAAGYAAERGFLAELRHPRLRTGIPLLGGFALSLAMAALGLKAARGH